MEYLIPLLMGIALAAVCGLRAFLPLFALSLAAYFDFVVLNSSFDWLDSTAAIIAFGIAVVLELVADKIPAVDNLLDTAAIYVKPVAAAIVVAGVAKDLDPVFAVGLGLITGGTLAAVIHLGKAAFRLASTVITAGLGNFAISVVEDVVSFITSILALFAPVIAIIVVGLEIVLAVRFVRKRFFGKRMKAKGDESVSEPDKSAKGETDVAC